MLDALIRIFPQRLQPGTFSCRFHRKFKRWCFGVFRKTLSHRGRRAPSNVPMAGLTEGAAIFKIIFAEKLLQNWNCFRI